MMVIDVVHDWLGKYRKALKPPRGAEISSATRIDWLLKNDNMAPFLANQPLGWLCCVATTSTQPSLETNQIVGKLRKLTHMTKSIDINKHQRQHVKSQCVRDKSPINSLGNCPHLGRATCSSLEYLRRGWSLSGVEVGDNLDAGDHEPRLIEYQLIRHSTNWLYVNIFWNQNHWCNQMNNWSLVYVDH